MEILKEAYKKLEDSAELAHIEKIIKLKEYKKPLDEAVLKI